MNTSTKTTNALLFSALNLIANSVLATGAHPNGPAITPDTDSKTQGNSAVNTVNSNQLEASFLKVYAGCKTDHASFEPVRIGVENVSDQVMGIHAQVEQA